MICIKSMTVFVHFRKPHCFSMHIEDLMINNNHFIMKTTFSVQFFPYFSEIKTTIDVLSLSYIQCNSVLASSFCFTACTKLFAIRAALVDSNLSIFIVSIADLSSTEPFAHILPELLWETVTDGSSYLF